MGPDRWRRVEELFHAATAMAGGDVRAFLDRECGDDDALRLEVESLLQSQGGGANLLDKTITEVAAGLFEERALGALTGTKLAHYELREPLGAGGMGEVYRAWDTVLARTAAIKVLGGRLHEEPNGQGTFLR